MSSPSPRRVQFVVSWRFPTLLLLSGGLLYGGYYWYQRQLQTQQQLEQLLARFQAPPYFVNRSASVFRICHQCLGADGQLKPQSEWKALAGIPHIISETQRRWFLAVENPPIPFTVAGVLMLPVHPAITDDNPAVGFDQTTVLLVLYQNLERKRVLEQLPPPAPPVQTNASSPPPAGPDDGKE